VGRIWNLRLNVDTFNGAYLKLRNDVDRLQYFLGFHLGCMDGEANCGDDLSFLAGFEIGKSMAEEAKEFSAKQSERGQASASKRRERSGTAQPHRTTPEPPFEPPFEPRPNQSTIHNPAIQETNKPASQSGQASKIHCNDFSPDSSHQGLCSIRSLSMELQLERFRAANQFGADTPESWGRRFTAWLARGRPELHVTPEKPAQPPTEDEWMAEAKAYAPTVAPIRDEPGYFWPAPLARAAFQRCAANSWKWVDDWRAKLRAECDDWSGKELANRKRPAR